MQPTLIEPQINQALRPAALAGEDHYRARNFTGLPYNPSPSNFQVPSRACFAAVIAASLLAGCAHHDRVTVVQTPAPPPQTIVVEKDRTPLPASPIVVHEAPPPPREEAVPPAPSPDQGWVPGHWEYQNENYTWISGHWETKPRPAAEYVPAHWEQRSDGYVYVGGYWKS